jgi:hypothetical protein
LIANAKLPRGERYLEDQKELDAVKQRKMQGKKTEPVPSKKAKDARLHPITPSGPACKVGR